MWGNTLKLSSVTVWGLAALLCLAGCQRAEKGALTPDEQAYLDQLRRLPTDIGGAAGVDAPTIFEPAHWVQKDGVKQAVAQFQIVDHPEYNANLDVVVRGVQTSKGPRCEIVKEGVEALKRPSKWNPLPFYMYTVANKEGLLEKNFNLTLDFQLDEKRDIRPEWMRFLVTFTRKKVFQSFWSIYTLYNAGAPAGEKCTAIATICEDFDANNGFICRENPRQIHRVLGTVSLSGVFGAQFVSDEKKKNDIDKLEIEVSRLDAGRPVGGSEVVPVRSFE